MSAKLRWDKGGEAEIFLIALEKISLVSTTPSPPGSRIEGVVAIDPPARLRVKVHGCKKEEEGRFRIEGRPLDLGRADLDRIALAVAH